MTSPRALALLLLLTSGCAEGLRGGLGATGDGGADPAGAGGAVAGDGSGGVDGEGPGATGTPTSSVGGGDGGGEPASTGSTSSGDGTTTTGTATTSSTASGSGAAPGTVFFSEYVEGEGQDKAIEIVNAGATPVSLVGCVLDRYQNGASSPSSPLALASVQLAPGATHVVCHTEFTEPVLCGQLDSGVQHSGNDVIVLRCDGEVEDVFGRIGEDAVWGVAPTTSRDATLRRRCDVVEGDRDGHDPFDPADAWDGFAMTDRTDLGRRSCP